MIKFRLVDFPADLEVSTRIIREAFSTVASDFGLSIDNCPTNPAFINTEKLQNLLSESRELYLLYENSEAHGFVAIEKASDEPGVYFIEKVAVLPDFRHRGLGKQIMEFAQERILQSGGNIASIAIIDENTRLKNWYRSLNFQETSTKKFDHMPFTVCFMKKQLR
jgi:ribosomal protein S18 acetylase RimI-like enzyme